MTPNSDFFRPHPNLADEINSAIARSEVEGGVLLEDLPVGARLEVETRHHHYDIVNRGGGEVMIMGHPVYCPEPVPVKVHGSTFGGSMLKMHFIGRGMRLEFRHPTHGVVRTSKIREIREAPVVPEAPELRQKAC